MQKEEIKWIFKLKDKVSQFLKRLKGQKISGFFHYALSGDLDGEQIQWGLGNTVFAVKIYYILNLLDHLPQKEKEAMTQFIKSFQKEDGTIYDPLIRKKAIGRNCLDALKNFNFQNILGKKTIQAETKQAISALKLLKEKPDIVYKNFPQTKRKIQEYLNKLNWQKPWDGGSHFSHLIFFLKNSDLKNRDTLINFAIDWVARLQNPQDGFWYQGNPSLQQKINGAMKIITGFEAGNKMNFQYPERIVDLCLAAKNNKQACDNFNIIYVLYNVSKITGHNYKLDKIKKFVRERLRIYRDYYFPQKNGFSFYPNQANQCYYGAKISRGLPEPDIHGTCMFLGGIAIIARILGIDQDLNWKTLIL